MNNRDFENRNPYKSPNSKSDYVQNPRHLSFKYFWLFGRLGSVAPFPLFYWVYDGEPFVIWDPFDIFLCFLSLAIGCGWVVWTFLLVNRFRSGGMPASALLLFLLPLIFANLSFFISYLYLHDRGLL